MVLKSVQLLLVAVTGFKKTFVAGAHSLKLTADASEFCIELHVFVLGGSHIVVELMVLCTLSILLSDQLALGFKQEAVALVSVFAVLL